MKNRRRKVIPATSDYRTIKRCLTFCRSNKFVKIWRKWIKVLDVIFGTADDKLDNNWRKLWILEARKLKTNTLNVKSFRFDSIFHRLEFICWRKSHLNYILRHGLSMFHYQNSKICHRKTSERWLTILNLSIRNFSFTSPKNISCCSPTAYNKENNWINCLMICRIICVDENYIYVIISPYVTIGH